MPNEMSRITERPPQDTNLIGSQNKQGTAFRYAEAETGRPVNYDRKTGEVRYFPKDMENFMRFTQSPKMTFNPVATHKAMENQQNESYANRRLDIILETVSQILEDAERARSRREHRKSEAKEAGERVASAFAVFGPGGIGNYDLERLGMVVKGSAQRKAAAAELVKARQQHQGTDEAQRILDVDSYKFGISPPERKDRYKARKKTRKK